VLLAQDFGEVSQCAAQKYIFAFKLPVFICQVVKAKVSVISRESFRVILLASVSLCLHDLTTATEHVVMTEPVSQQFNPVVQLFICSQQQ
jgi:hypothetical protein